MHILCLFVAISMLSKVYSQLILSWSVRFSVVNDILLFLQVGFHAVEIDASLSMAWLATGVWKGLPIPPPVVHPDTITENKIQVFR